MNIKQDGLVLLCAVIGGVLGYFGFFLLARQGYYGMILPGGLVGVGAGLFRTKSKYVAVVCGVLALVLGLYTEWRFRPFIADDSLGYFLAHLHKLSRVSQIMLVVGTIIGFWVPFRRTQDARRVLKDVPAK
jgi:hypothetical protein